MSRDQRLHTNLSSGGGSWASAPLRHPANFETLALEAELKSRVVEDLTSFAAGKEFYNRVGRRGRGGISFTDLPDAVSLV